LNNLLRASLASFLLLPLSGCAVGKSATSAPVAKAAPSASTPQPATVRWTLTSRGVDDLEVGSPLPAKRAQNAALATQYTTAYYGDGQPLEGFTFEDPPVFAVVSGGPFRAFANEHPGQPPSAKVKSRALDAARASKLSTQMLVVTDPQLKTTLGIGVGEDAAAFSRAYPQAALTPIPALWEEPSCVAQSDTLWFFFDRCDHDPRARIIRIVVRDTK